MNFGLNYKESIVEQIQKYAKEINECIKNLSTKELNGSIIGKWSINENLEHLTISNTILSISMRLPKIAIKTIGGTPSEKRNANEIIHIYQKKLLAGASSSFAFNPNIPIKNKKMIESMWNNSIALLTKSINQWEESDLDKYAMPHPIIGQVSVREMLFFTVYHIYHHGNTIKTLAIYSKV